MFCNSLTINLLHKITPFYNLLAAFTLTKKHPYFA